MKPEEIDDYISALVDKQFTGLSDEEIETLHKLINEYPEYFGEYQLDIATKLCLMKHVKPVKCPQTTANNIKKSLLRMLSSLQSAR